jgi:hypothetical protein
MSLKSKVLGVGRSTFVGLRRSIFFGVFASVLTAVGATAALASSETGFDAVVDALKSGKAVTMVVDLSRCTDDLSHKSGPSVIAGLKIRSFMLVPNKAIRFSDLHGMVDPNGGEITEYVAYLLDAKGVLTIRVNRTSLGEVTYRDEISCRLPPSEVFRWR